MNRTYPASKKRLVSCETMDFVLQGSRSAVLLRYRGCEEHVSVPETIHGLPVTQIGSSAFEGSRVRYVEVPVTVRAIGDAAFKGCENLRCVSIFPIREPETAAAKRISADPEENSGIPGKDR